MKKPTIIDCQTWRSRTKFDHVVLITGSTPVKYGTPGMGMTVQYRALDGVSYSLYENTFYEIFEPLSESPKVEPTEWSDSPDWFERRENLRKLSEGVPRASCCRLLFEVNRADSEFYDACCSLVPELLDESDELIRMRTRNRLLATLIAAVHSDVETIITTLGLGGSVDVRGLVRRNEKYYRELLERAGRAVGPSCYKQDDGGIVDSPLVSRVPGIVEDWARDRRLEDVPLFLECCEAVHRLRTGNTEGHDMFSASLASKKITYELVNAVFDVLRKGWYPYWTKVAGLDRGVLPVENAA